jgi:hypothetical protein
MYASGNGLLAGLAIVSVLGTGVGVEATIASANVDDAAMMAFRAPQAAKIVGVHGNELAASQVVGEATLNGSSALGVSKTEIPRTDTQQAVPWAIERHPYGAQASESDATSRAVTFSNPVEQECADVALQEPQIIKSEVLHAGDFTHVPLESYYLSSRYQPWPEACKEGLYARGNQARPQAFHNGHWVNMAYWRSVNIIEDTNAGNWEGEIADLVNLEFPVCRARILLKANMVDLSVSMNPDIPWQPQHPTIARKQFTPIPAHILPHKPKGC